MPNILAPGDESPRTPDELCKQADNIVLQVLPMTEHDRKATLKLLKRVNPVMHALVKDKLHGQENGCIDFIPQYRQTNPEEVTLIQEQCGWTLRLENRYWVWFARLRLRHWWAILVCYFFHTHAKRERKIVPSSREHIICLYDRCPRCGITWWAGTGHSQQLERK